MKRIGKWFLCLVYVGMVLAPLVWAADQAINARTELAAAPAEDDILPIYDTSATAGKRITVLNFLNALEAALTGYEIHQDNLPTTWTGTFTFGNGATSAGFIKFLEDSDNGTNTATLIGPASTADVTVTLPAATDTLVGKATTDELTNKTLDASGTGNVLKQTKQIVLTHPHLCASGAAMQTTSTANTYGQCLFGNATDKATNYAEYYLVVPADVDTAVDLTGTFKIKLSNADTGDHEYEISFDSVADSATYAGSLGDAISLAYTADASGAQNDVETAGPTTLTGWRSAMTAGNLMVIRVARDGDHANDTSTVDSYSGPLVVTYGSTL